MTDKKFNVGIIGYGLAAKIFHIPFIAVVPSLNLYAIVQRNPQPDNDAEKDHPGIKSFRSTEEMVKDPDLDVVVVTSIPDTHLELCKTALNAGKHVVCEKPFVPTSAEAEELIELAKKTGKLLSVYQNRRFDADFLTLQSVLPKLGRLSEFETHFDRHRPQQPKSTWKTKELPAAGAIYDLGTHLIDQVVTLFGLPRKITAFIGNQREGVIYGKQEVAGDSFTIILRYDTGLVVTAKAAVVGPEVQHLRFWARGDKGGFMKYHLDVQEEQLHKGMRPGDENFGVEDESRWGTLTSAAADNKITPEKCATVKPKTYAEFYALLAQALAGKADVPVKAEEARDVIRIIEKCKESASTERTVDFFR